MKAKLLLISVAIFGLTLSSCENEEFYSCDPTLDQWAKENYDKIQNFTTTEFLTLDIREQKAAYAAMGVKQRHEIWLSKLNEVLQLTWTPEETEHIQSLISFIKGNQSLFANSKTNGLRDEFELYMYGWTEHAIEKLGWEKETIYSICGDPNNAEMTTTRSGRTILTVPKTQEFMATGQLSTIKTRGEYGPTCSCSQQSDFCDIFGEIPDWVVSCNDYNYDCEVVIEDCGAFWQFDCDGVCKAPIA